jgi:hypothetical protein
VQLILSTWEKTAASNFGLEFDRLEIGYLALWIISKESVDLIYDKPLPGSTGNTEIITNVGALKKLWLGSFIKF